MGTLHSLEEARAQTGCSNSLSRDTQCRFLPEIGIDTISLCWKGAEPVDRLLRLDGLLVGEDRRPLRVVPAPGRSVRLSRRLDGLGTVGSFPAASLLYVEGRAGALHAHDETDHSLAPVAVLPQTQERVRDDLSELLGTDLESTGAIRRIDLSGELRFARGEDGQALLRVLDALHSPRHKTSPVRERGGPGIETAYWRTPTRSVPILRAYDKGIESGTARAGERIRIERQLRYPGARRPSLSQWLTTDLGEAYVGPLRHWLTDGIAAGTAHQLLEAFTDAALTWPSYWASGSSWAGPGRTWRPLWPVRKVERLIGTLTLINAYGGSWEPYEDRQRQRRLKELRDLGVVLLDEPIHIDAHALVTGLCEEWRKAA